MERPDARCNEGSDKCDEIDVHEDDIEYYSSAHTPQDGLGAEGTDEPTAHDQPAAEQDEADEEEEEADDRQDPGEEWQGEAAA